MVSSFVAGLVVGPVEFFPGLGDYVLERLLLGTRNEIAVVAFIGGKVAAQRAE